MAKSQDVYKSLNWDEKLKAIKLVANGARKKNYIKQKNLTFH